MSLKLRFYILLPSEMKILHQFWLGSFVDYRKSHHHFVLITVRRCRGGASIVFQPAFAISIFQWAQLAEEFLVIKVSRNLSCHSFVENFCSAIYLLAQFFKKQL